MTAEILKEKLLEFVRPSYPDMAIEVVDELDKRHVCFTDEKFTALYPLQRYHYLSNLIPRDFYESELTETVWYELTPGENPRDLNYLDRETTDAIRETIIDILKGKTGFVSKLDGLFLTKGAMCYGDFRYAKEILTDLKFSDEEQFDIFHVLMHEGGYCDCEILYNVFRESGYAQKYWTERNG